ncbi:MAG TPA: hypothetical protein VHF89_12005 [Solirubrobacteraceae bacterium]|nr:hypothetical protein [Solirubrobacteraceae bacterium]
MLAYKFLRAGAVGPFSGVAWPQPRGGAPGEWVEAAGGTSVCRRGVHACRLEDLPRWIGRELWAVELRGGVLETPYKVVAPAGRLARRIDAWDDRAAAAFAEACIERVRALAASGPAAIAGYVQDAEANCLGPRADEDPPLAAAVAAVIAAHAAGDAGGAEAVARERATQVAWFRERLRLS